MADFPLSYELLERIVALPLGGSEFEQVSYYQPVAIKYIGDTPSLCALVAPSLLGYGLLTPEGIWRPAYRPIALRCLPYILTRGAADGSGKDLRRVAPDGNLLDGPDSGADDEAQKRNSLGLVRASRDELRAALDALQLAGVLAPLAAEGKPGSNFLSVVRSRYNKLTPLQFLAMSRANLMPILVASSILQSRSRLHSDFRLKSDEPINELLAEKPSQQQAIDTLVAPMLDAAGIWLDDSETF